MTQQHAGEDRLSPDPAGSYGFALPELKAVRDRFDALLASRPGWSGAFAAYVDGRPVVDLWGGPDYNENSLQAMFSSTKGVTGICMAVLHQRGLLDLNAPVADYWPEFAAAGKGAIPVRWLLSHQAGLIGVPGGFSLADFLAHDPLAEKLAALAPYWEPGTAHGYHSLTIGVLAGELVRRITGKNVGTFFADEIARPLGVDFWIGLPEAEEARVVPVGPAPAPVPGVPVRELSAVANNVHPGFPTIRDLVGLREVRAADLPAVGGIGSARGLARLYGACVSEVDGQRILSEETVRTVTEPQCAGDDLVAPLWTSFGIMFQMTWPGYLPMAGPGSFGHDGYGGTQGFAHPRYRLGFGFTTNRVPPLTGADPVTGELAEAVLAGLGLK
jgi:CubicO group peptidase (beta-lactamase class C family)